MFLRSRRLCSTGFPTLRQNPRFQFRHWHASKHIASLKVHPLSDWQSARRFHAPGFLYQKSDEGSPLHPPAFLASFDLVPASHQIEDLDLHHVGTAVALHGYLGSRSDTSKSKSFVDLTDSRLSKSIQIISSLKEHDQKSAQVHARLKSCNSNAPVVVLGTIQKKAKPKNPPKEKHPKRNEDIEVLLSDLTVLNTFPEDILFEKDTNLSAEQRHLQLKQSDVLRDALYCRDNITRIARTLMVDEHGFLEVETPLLFKSTPEGAREFLVPTRTLGLVYALPQSPQQYKQILMASGIPRYFQLAKCFRDEDLRADRQPEFTQLDVEMAFASSSDVMAIIENLIRRCWEMILHVHLAPGPFLSMSYEQAMSKYGSDKPDTRIGMEIFKIGHMLPVDLKSKIGPLTDPIVEAFRFTVSEEPQKSREFISNFMDSPEAAPFIKNSDGQPGIFIYDSRKPLGGLQPFGFEAAEQVEDVLQVEEGDVVILQARKNEPFSGGSTTIGDLRLALHRAAVSAGLMESPSGWSFLWINNFPLFSPINETDPGQGGEAGIASTHHPFTCPATLQDVDLLSTNPSAAKADHYDLVLNGVELGGGSRRIHDAAVQEFVLRNILKMSEERLQDFKHLLDALRAGCPPHAGIALGLDRLVAIMLRRQSIRDVIAFPKSGSGEDLLVKSPGKITNSQLDAYHLQIKP